MKQKYLAVALSFCLLFNFCTPLTTNAETIDETIVSADDGIECIEEVVAETVEESFNDEQEIKGTNSDETVADQNELNVLSVEEMDNEAVIDFSDGSLISDLKENVLNTQDVTENTENEGYTRASYKGTDYDYGFKYDSENKILYIKVWEGCTTAAIQGTTNALTGWVYSADNAPNGIAKDEISNIRKVVIGDGITAISKMAFTSKGTIFYSALEEIIIPDSLTTIGISAFANTTSLRKIDCKNVSTVGNGAFSGCKGLKSISFNNPLVTIGQAAFMNNSSLTSICYAGTSEQWKESSKNALDDMPSTVRVHCRADVLAEKAATCENDGLELTSMVCDACGTTYSVGTVMDKLGHKVADTYTVDKIATCTETGEQSKHCTREGCEYREDIQTIPIDSENHDWTSAVTTEPTCTKEGVLTYTCSRCKGTKTEPIKATGEHSWTSAVTTEPTCTKEGVLTYTCSSCEGTRTEPIKATGVHQWSDWKTTKAATVFEAEQQTRTCSSCDKTETQTVGTALKAKASVNTSTVKLKVNKSTSGLKVTGLANGDSVKKWKSSNTKIFTVSGNADGTCKLTAKKKGTAKLEITMASGLKKTVTVKVQSGTVATTKISGLTSKLTIQKGSKTTLKPVITPFTSTQKVTYSSSNKKVASVSSKGVITAKKAGTAKITVKSGGKKVVVTVTVPKTKTTDVTVAAEVTVKKGKTYSLKAKVTPSNSDQKITYTSSNKKIATVTKAGKIKGVKKGTATITVKSGSVTKKVKVTVR